MEQAVANRAWLFVRRSPASSVAANFFLEEFWLYMLTAACWFLA
jgi:hypothetical protein